MRFFPWLRGGVGTLAMIACLSGCHPAPASDTASPPARIVLFDGTGTSPNDVKAIEVLLTREKLSYATADEDELDVMTPEQLSHVDLLIMPGGNFEEMGKNLSAQTPERIRDAVRGGVNYLGICAGAFIAGDSPNGLKLADQRFAFFADSAKGVRKETVTLINGDGTRFPAYWEDGPQLTGWGDPLAKYPDGTPAVVQGKVGKGWVVLTGVHLEAPENWYQGIEPGRPAVSNAYAVKLIRAAFDGAALPYL
jgi:glutamine amidotransferase-like uncharacterized protein